MMRLHDKWFRFVVKRNGPGVVQPFTPVFFGTNLEHCYSYSVSTALSFTG